jgi:hypothetical protein
MMLLLSRVGLAVLRLRVERRQVALDVSDSEVICDVEARVRWTLAVKTRLRRGCLVLALMSVLESAMKRMLGGGERER